MSACGDDDGGDVRTIDDSGSGSASASGSASGSASEPASGSAAADLECAVFGDKAAADRTVGVVLTEFTITPETDSVEAGLIHFELENEGEEPHEFVVIKGVAPADLPLDEDGALVEDDLPAGALIGEVEPFPAGETCDGTFVIDAGDYSLVCNIVEDGEHGAHLHEGMVTEFTAT